MPASDYVDEQLLEWAFEATAFPSAPGLWVALFTVAPGKSGGGTEVSGGSYARVQTAISDWNVNTTSSPHEVVNVEVLEYATPTAPWGTVVAFGILDALTSGNLLFYGNLNASKTIGTNQEVVFNIGSLNLAGAT